MKKIELDKIYNEDCIEGMKRIPSDSINAIITDPPYCIGTTSNGKKGSYNDNNLIKPFFEILFKEWVRVCKEGAELYINTDWRTYPFLYPILQKYFQVKNLIVWDYEWIKAGSHYRFSHEFIIYAVKGEVKRRFSASERDVWRIRPINFTSPDKLHNAQKPLELIDKMIRNSSVEGDVILDCFSGSGTTAVACINNKRHYICFEIDESYFQISLDRIRNVLSEPKLAM